MGVTVAQRGIDPRPNTFLIVQHIIVPKSDHPVSFLLDSRRPHRIDLIAMLPAIDLNHQFRAMAGKVGDEVADWNLVAETRVREGLAKESPEPSFRVGHFAAQATGARDSAGRRMMLQASCFTSNITPPQPLPIKGRGF